VRIPPAWLVCALAVAPVPWAHAGPVIDVTPAPAAGVFHHLGSSGRRSLAVSDTHVAIAWEDDSSGAPQVYCALKAHGDDRFPPALRASTTNEAYEPAVVHAGAGVFVLAYEGDGRVWLQTCAAHGTGRALALGGAVSRQATLDAAAGEIQVAWSEQRGGHYNVRHASYTVAPGGELREAQAAAWVEARATGADQFYPAVTTRRGGATLLWEDRQAGHTRIVAAQRAHGADHFEPHHGVNHWNRPDAGYDKGSGAMRPALARDNDVVLAVWLDKRGRVDSAYDVFAAFSHDGGRQFGADGEVGDGFARNQPQRNPVPLVLANGRYAVVWDDPRDGSADLWISWRTAARWSDDQAIAVAAGAGEQLSPAAAVDELGQLHLAWVDRARPDAPTRIRYTVLAPPAP